MSYIPCSECDKPVNFETQRAYSESGCHTENGSVVKCSKHGGKDFYEDSAEKLLRNKLT
tara:strand:+ start:6067 stop:6243 length:177 start_codon:yes stop_codon:yes gene_type:complete